MQFHCLPKMRSDGQKMASAWNVLTDWQAKMPQMNVLNGEERAKSLNPYQGLRMSISVSTQISSGNRAFPHQVSEVDGERV